MVDFTDFFRLMTMTGAKRNDDNTFQVGQAELTTFKMLVDQERRTEDLFKHDQFTQNTDWLNKF